MLKACGMGKAVAKVKTTDATALRLIESDEKRAKNRRMKELKRMTHKKD
jgi:hypothetical protein